MELVRAGDSFMQTVSHPFHVIGFDARYPCTLPTRGPWTVDEALCRPAFESEGLVARLSDPGLQSLWASFSGLRSAFEVHSVAEGAQYVAVTWSESLALDIGCYPEKVSGPVDGIFWWYPEEQHRVSPRELGRAWQFLGYDVADAWLLSGLWNCEFERTGDRRTLDRDYYSLLNCHGLFEELSLAQAFCKTINTLAREHAPFTPYGVWSHEAPSS